MTPVILDSRFGKLRGRLARLGLWRRLAIVWAAAALVAFAALFVVPGTGLPAWGVATVLGGLALLAALVVAVRHLSRPADARALAKLVERRHPELDGLLLTAVQQEPARGAGFSYFQRRVVREAVEHSRVHDWAGAVPGARIALSQALHLAALALFAGVLWSFRTPPSGGPPSILASLAGITVTPGDTQIERGESLVVLARFGGSPPAAAELIVAGAGVPERRFPLTRSLADPVFGGSVPDVTNALSYSVEYAGKRTREFRVSVFEHPRLERADADLAYPAYTQLAPKHIDDTRRLTAVEGTRLDLTLALNKPVVSATLVPRSTNAASIVLVPVTNAPAAHLAAFPLASPSAYELRLVDADGRTNKVPTLITFDVVPNRTPELKFASPRGDLQPSAIEEVPFEGTVWDDFGMPAHGLAYTVAGKDTQFVELGTAVPGGEKRKFNHLLRLEELGVQPDDLVSWYLWADDIGPDGNVRRTTSDLFFGEIRPFEQIFRENSSGGGEQQQQAGGGQQEGSPTSRLADLQKQILNATWKLRRTFTNASPAYVRDAGVVRESQNQAREQASETSEDVSGVRERQLWDDVLRSMDDALRHLSEAAKNPKTLTESIASEQAAYQALLKLQAREFEVARSRSRGGGGGGGGGRNQAQIDQLELTQSENRYETERQAQAPADAERREQLNVLSRLRELAQRQEDVNQQLRELQTALQEARNDTEREDIRRRLKRLQEEQQQMLADTDELQQRLQRPENQSRTGEQQRRLDQARSDMQRSAEATGDGAVSQALAAGSRAERQLEDMRDELRKQSASQFSDDLREMRADARELSRRQEEITREIRSSERPERTERRSLASEDKSSALGERLGSQRTRLTNLVDRATQLSQAAEEAEPLASRHLYDALRKLTQDEAQSVRQMQEELVRRGRMTRDLYDRLQRLSEQEGPRSLDMTSELLRQGSSAEAAQAGARAQDNIDTLRRGVERAAETVLGDDTAALQLARDELDRLTRQLEEEIAANTGGRRSGESRDATEGQGEPGGQSGAARSPPGAETAANDGNPPSQDGAGEQAGDRPGGNQPAQQGQGGQGGASAQKQGQEQAQAQAQAQAGSSQGGEGNQPGQGEQGQPGGQGGQVGRSGQAGRDQAAQAGQTPGDRQRTGEAGAGRTGGARNLAGGGGGGGGGRASTAIDRLLGADATADGRVGSGPITSEGFGPWADRLREVEEMIELPDLRTQVATARERARVTRLELKRELKKPDWAVVRLQVVKPLVEVRSRIADELARRAPDNDLVPIDRDPVPTRYSELVRRYYEELGRDR